MFICIFGTLEFVTLVNLLHSFIKVHFKKKRERGKKYIEGRRSRGHGRGRGAKRVQESRERETTAEQKRSRVPLVFRNLL